MNTYTFNSHNKEVTITGVNLESALTDYGLTNIEIIPLWRGKSNGKYKVYCSEHTILICKWLNKKFKLRKDGRD